VNCITHARVDQTWCDGVDTNPAWTPLHGHLLGEQSDSSLCRGVGPAIWSWNDAIHRRDADDASWFACVNHACGNLARDGERSDEIDVDDCLEVFLGDREKGTEANDSRVVDEQVGGIAELLQCCGN